MNEKQRDLSVEIEADLLPPNAGNCIDARFDFVFGNGKPEKIKIAKNVTMKSRMRYMKQRGIPCSFY